MSLPEIGGGPETGFRGQAVGPPSGKPGMNVKNSPRGDHFRANNEATSLREVELNFEAKISHVLAILRDRGVDPNQNEKLDNMVYDMDSVKSNHSQLVNLVTTLQTHIGEEHIHRINGQQELREVISAEITARRKAQNKNLQALEKLSQKQDQELSTMKGELRLLAENIGTRINVIESNVSAAVTALFQEVRDIKEYTRNTMQLMREEVQAGGGNNISAGKAGSKFDGDIHTALVDKVEELYDQTSTRFEQISNQSRDAWNGLNERIAGCEMTAKSLNFGLESEIRSRSSADQNLKMAIVGEMEGMIEDAVNARLNARLKEMERRSDVGGVPLADNMLADVQQDIMATNDIISNNTTSPQGSPKKSRKKSPRSPKSKASSAAGSPKSNSPTYSPTRENYKALDTHSPKANTEGTNIYAEPSTLNGTEVIVEDADTTVDTIEAAQYDNAVDTTENTIMYADQQKTAVDPVVVDTHMDTNEDNANMDDQYDLLTQEHGKAFESPNESGSGSPREEGEEGAVEDADGEFGVTMRASHGSMRDMMSAAIDGNGEDTEVVDALQPQESESNILADTPLYESNGE